MRKNIEIWISLLPTISYQDDTGKDAYLKAFFKNTYHLRVHSMRKIDVHDFGAILSRNKAMNGLAVKCKEFPE
jgi:hypothetical protein